MADLLVFLLYFILTKVSTVFPDNTLSVFRIIFLVFQIIASVNFIIYATAIQYCTFAVILRKTCLITVKLLARFAHSDEKNRRRICGTIFVRCCLKNYIPKNRRNSVTSFCHIFFFILHFITYWFYLFF